MADNTILAFNCLNPNCKKPIKLRRPQKTGIYGVKCPHCGYQAKIKLPGEDKIHIENQSQRPTILVPDNSSKARITVEDGFIVGYEYKFGCPHCKKQEIAFNSQKAGHKEFACPLCHGQLAVDVRDKTKVLDLDSETIQFLKGKLVLVRRGWINKDYPLLAGKTIVGRDDETAPSDISIKGDSSMSRRSIEILVQQSEKGYTFKLTVLNVTNPVLHNNKPLMKGESVSLNFGDTILLGKTKFRFEKDK